MKLKRLSMGKEILIVDDEADIRMLTSGILEDEGYQTRKAGKSDDALKAVKSRRPDLVLLDIWLQGSDLDGLQVLRRIKHLNPGIPVLMMSGHGTIETAVTAIKEGAYDFIEKPFKADRLLLIVERALEAAELKRENLALRFRAGPELDLIGSSREIKDIRLLIENAAPTNSRILISGPAGSGKEVVARKIHTRSTRSRGPIEIFNCASLSLDRAEEELFGLEPSQNAPSNGASIGAIESAHNGTLVLDEVSDLPIEIQGKLVRVLQEQVFQRIGGTSSVEVDLRVLATNSRNLQKEIADGRFRQDLFYRLNVVPITIPPLRSRREDLGALASHFLRHSCETNGQPLREFAPDAIAMLQNFDWPGNVRELKNIVERIVILGANDVETKVTASALPSEVRGVLVSSAETNWQDEVMGMPLRDARESFEKYYLTRQIERFQGKITKTAEFVGMERSALHRKIKSLSVSLPNKDADS